MKKVSKIISSLIFIGIIIGLFLFVYIFYSKYYFNDYIKAQENMDGTSFYRDSKVKFSKNRSYCIENTDFNDSVFYKKVEVEPNTPYRVTCMVKTENIESEENNAGACISLINKGEQSEILTGNNDWTKLSFNFNSKQNEELEIGFRLGGNNGDCKGKAWFSDIKLEKGNLDEDNNWNVVCFIIDNIDVNINDKEYDFSMTYEDKQLIKDNLERFAVTCKDFSNGNMTVSTNLIEISDPVSKISYDEENGFYFAAEDVKDVIAPYVSKEEYDHIFIAIRMGDANKNSEIPVNDWIGLGGMDYNGIGFSNIRLPNDLKNSYMYKYSARYNTFPEEVFVHEFLHSLERNLKERDYVIPALHDSSNYGYESEGPESLKNWYKDYMAKEINDSNGEKVGLDSIVYSTKPIQNSNFEISEEIKFDNEPNNFFSGIFQLFKNLKNMSGQELNMTTTKEVVTTN